MTEITLGTGVAGGNHTFIIDGTQEVGPIHLERYGTPRNPLVPIPPQGNTVFQAKPGFQPDLELVM